jgi:predicted secreted Zn-dependent protease
MLGMSIRHLSAALLGILPFAALGQIHMCEGPDGRKVFSDVTCGPNAKAVEVKPATGGSSIYPDATSSNDYYDIRGTTVADLRREIQGKGPEGWWGMAHTRMTYRITMRKADEGCAVDTVRASADAKVRLPRWANRHEGSRAAQDEWDTIIRTLDLHERGHVQISLDGAKELERSLREIPPAPSCDLIDAEAKRRFGVVTNLVHRRQATYDSDTDHGRNQWSPYRQ